MNYMQERLDDEYYQAMTLIETRCLTCGCGKKTHSGKASTCGCSKEGVWPFPHGGRICEVCLVKEGGD